MDKLLISTSSWTRVLATRIVRKLCESEVGAAEDWNHDLLASGMLERLLTMWCKSDASIRKRCADDVAYVVSMESSGAKVVSASDGTADSTIVTTLFAALYKGLEKPEEKQEVSKAVPVQLPQAMAVPVPVPVSVPKKAKEKKSLADLIDIPENNTTADITIDFNQFGDGYDGGDMPLPPNNVEFITETNIVANKEGEKLLRVVAKSLKELTETPKGVSMGSISIPPVYIRDLLQLLALPYDKVKLSLLKAIKNLLSNPDNMICLSVQDVNQHLHFIFETLLSSNIDLHSLALDLIIEMLTYDKVSPLGKIEMEVLSRNYLVTEMTRKYLSEGNENQLNFALSNLPFDHTELDRASWDTDLIYDVDTSLSYQQLFKGKIGISSTMPYVKGFVHENISNAGGLSLFLWVNLSKKYPGDPIAGLIAHFGGGDSRFQIKLNAIGCIQVMVPLDSSSPSTSKSSSTEKSKTRFYTLTGNVRLREEEWTFVAITIANFNAGGEVCLYVGNDLDAKGTLTSSTYLSKALKNPYPWFLGITDPAILRGVDPIEGMVENVKLFGSVLTHEEVRLISKILPLQLYGLRFCFAEATHHISNIVNQLSLIDYQLALENSKGSSLMTEANDDVNAYQRQLASENAFKFASGLLCSLELFCRDAECASSLISKDNFGHTHIDFLLALISQGMAKVRSEALLARGSNSSVLVIEKESSSHPYVPNSSTIDMVSYPEQPDNPVKALKVWFDNKTSTLKNSGVIEFFLDANCTNSIGGPFSGTVRDPNKNWPTTKYPFYVPASKFWVSFKSDSSSVDEWGWKLYATACEDPYQARKERPKCKVLSSLNFPNAKYEPNLCTYEKVVIPGAEVLEIVFHPLSATEKKFDYIKFFKNDSHTDYWGKERYSGPREEKSFPSCSDPLIIPSDTVVVNFCSDASNEFAGFELVISEPQEQPIPKEMQLLRRTTKLFEVVASSARDQKKFVDLLLSDNATGLRMFVHLLDVAQSDNTVVENSNSLLISLVSNVELLALILDATSAQKSTTGMTERWLTTMVALLTSETDWLQEVFYSDISPRPITVDGLSYSKDFTFPLAANLKITFLEGCQLSPSYELLIKGDPNDLAASKSFGNESIWESFELEGGRLSLGLSCKPGSGDSSRCGGYGLEVTPEYDIVFETGVKNATKIINGKGLDLIYASLQSNDEMTQLMACRAVANLMFSSTDADRKKVLSSGLPLLLNLSDSENDTLSSIFTLSNSSSMSYCVIAENLKLTAKNCSNKTAYFEVKLLASDGVAISMVSPKHTIKSETAFHDYPKDLNYVSSVFGAELPNFFFVYDGAKGHLQLGNTVRKIDAPSWQRGDIIGISVNFASKTLQLFVNENLLFQVLMSDSLFSGVFEKLGNGFEIVPAIFLSDNGESKVYVNFGQENFLYGGISNSIVSLFEICKKTPMPKQSGFILRKVCNINL